MKKLLPIFFMMIPFAVYAALPSSPLDSIYTINGSETLTDSPYEVSSGTLNIGSDGIGEGALQINYSSATVNVFSGAGTVNVGTDSTAGSFTLTGTNSNFPIDQYKNIMNFSGTINVNKMGTFTMNGYIPSSWGQVFEIGTLNVKGSVIVERTGASNSYIQIKNLNLYEGGKFNSSQGMRTSWGAVWNLYTSELYTSNLRVGSTGGAPATINLKTADALKNVNNLSIDTSNVTLNLNVDNYNNTIKLISLQNATKLNITLAADRSDSSKLIISQLNTKNSESNLTASTMTLKNFDNDAIFFGIGNGIQIKDNMLYLESRNTYINLSAYTGTQDDTIIDGIWSLEWNETLGAYALNNSAIPEPSTIASIIGALAFLSIFIKRYRR